MKNLFLFLISLSVLLNLDKFEVPTDNPKFACNADNVFCTDFACCIECWRIEDDLHTYLCYPIETLSRAYHKKLMERRWKRK